MKRLLITADFLFTLAICSAIWRRPSNSRLICAACSSGLSSCTKTKGKSKWKNNQCNTFRSCSVFQADRLCYIVDTQSEWWRATLWNRSPHKGQTQCSTIQDRVSDACPAASWGRASSPWGSRESYSYSDDKSSNSQLDERWAHVLVLSESAERPHCPQSITFHSLSSPVCLHIPRLASPTHTCADLHRCRCYFCTLLHHWISREPTLTMGEIDGKCIFD